MRTFDVSFVVSLNEQLDEQSTAGETPRCSCDVTVMITQPCPINITYIVMKDTRVAYLRS